MPKGHHPLILPAIAPTESAKKALQLMRAHQRSAIVSFSIGSWHLYEASNVVITLSEDPWALLSDVPETRLVMHVARHGSMAQVTPRTPRAPEGNAVRRGPAPGGRPARTLTMARLKALAVGPRDCYCRIDLKAVIDGRTGGDCPDGHRGTVRCV
jgi:hypothetical protein